jgi:exonuclease VII small subunit
MELINRSKSIVLFTASIVLTMASGFVSKQSNADFMRGHVSSVQAQAQGENDLKAELAGDWENGQKLVASGTRNIEEGEKRVGTAERDLKRGKDQVERGNRELSEGTQLVQNSERRLQEAFQIKLTGDQ